MRKSLRVLLFGFLIWLIAFLVSVLIFPLRASARPLFESLMPVVIALATVLFAIPYLRNETDMLLQAGIRIGLSWLAINLIIDLVLFLPESPMQMSLGDYMMDIGITYLIIPVVTIGMGFLLERKSLASQ